VKELGDDVSPSEDDDLRAVAFPDQGGESVERIARGQLAIGVGIRPPEGLDRLGQHPLAGGADLAVNPFQIGVVEIESGRTHDLAGGERADGGLDPGGSVLDGHEQVVVDRFW